MDLLRRMRMVLAGPAGAVAGLDLPAAPAGTRPRRLTPSMAWTYAVLGADLLAIALAFVAAFYLAGLANQVVFGRWWLVTPEEVTLRIYDFTVISLAMLSQLYRRGHYIRRLAFWTGFADLMKVCLGGMLLDTFMQFLLKQTISRSWFVWIWLLMPLALLGMRALARVAMKGLGLWQRRVLIAGDASAARLAQAALLSDRSMGYEIAGRVTLDAVMETSAGASHAALMRRFEADFLVCAPGDEPFQMPRRKVAELVREHIDFAIMPNLEGFPTPGFHAQYFDGYDVVLLSYRANAAWPLARAAKVAMDVVGSALLLALLSPVILLIALMIKRDGGPVFYAQPRVGLGGRMFGCLKFRSMVMNADQVLKDTLAKDPRAAAEWAAAQKLRRDPRVTTIGRILRATSLDELPQLINVLRMDMSLVGPRPIVEKEIARYRDDFGWYVAVRPGLTGLWQVSGRSDTSYARKVHLDAWYVRNWSLWQDIVILLRTVPTVLLRRGAM